MKVFLSSTYADLVEHRKAAAEALERLGQQVGRMEIFGARPHEPSAACRREIEDCHLFVGIYAHRYGYVPPASKTSITEQELVHAQQTNKPIFCFVVADDYELPAAVIEPGAAIERVQELKRKIRSEFVVDTFREPLDLAVKVATSVGRFLLQHPEVRTVPAENDLAKRDRATLISLLEVRKEAIVRRFRDAQLLRVNALFLELHDKNIKAIEQGQLLLSHELTSHIHALLWLKMKDSDDPSWTSEDVPGLLYEPGGREREQAEIVADYPAAPIGRESSAARENWPRASAYSRIKRLASSDQPLSAIDVEKWCLEDWWQPVAMHFETRLRTERKEADASRRGPMETRVTSGGAGRCPFCKEPFTLSRKDSDDLYTCRHCRTRMQITRVTPETPRGHDFVNGLCRKCGRSEHAATFFGWHCDDNAYRDH